MAELNQDGLPIIIGDVELVTPGLAGTVEVHDGGGAGTRAAEDDTEAFLEALSNTGLLEQVTVEIRDHQETGGGGAGSRTGADGVDMEITVAGPGTGFGQVVLYNAEDGSLSWHLPENLPATEVPSRGTRPLTYHIPRTVMPVDGSEGQRGIIGAIGTKIIKVLFFRLADPVVGAAGNWFAARYEEKYRPHRLRTFDPDTYTTTGRDLQAQDWDRLGAGQSLLLVHGTASSSQNGFRTLPRTLVEELHSRYQGRVFAFDHPTISVPPDDNVRWFAAQLPPGVRLELDLLAHSRGGLVSRVMAEEPADVGLNERVNVRTLVMVATPNAGTVLADQAHIKFLMDRLTNILQFIPDNGVTDVLDVVLSILKQLAIGVFKGLDGLMSMDPKGSFLTEYLNLQGPSSSTRYYAVAANYDPPRGSSLFRVARNEATDLVFGGAPNDLIVPTEGVFVVPAARNFPVAAPVLFVQADGVDHSTYWHRPPFVAALRQWLTG
jgi:pimeloyl-ACP methyl ester carboxylesterase